MARNAMELKIVASDRLLGPLPLEELAEMAARGRIAAEDLVRPVGSGVWLRVTEVPRLAERLAPRPAPQPASQPASQPAPRPTPPAAPPAASQPTPQPASQPLPPPVAQAVAEVEDDELDESGGAEARVWRPRRKPHEEAAMEMAPMIDVTFLLLIFFMLTNSLANPASMAVPEALHGRGVTLEGQQLILIDEQGEYFLGESATRSSRADSLAALVKEVQANVRSNPVGLDVIISAHKDVKHLYVRQLLEGLASIDHLGQTLVGVEEKLD